MEKFLPPNEITPTSILWRPRYFVCFELCAVVAFVCPRIESMPFNVIVSTKQEFLIHCMFLTLKYNIITVIVF